MIEEEARAVIAGKFGQAAVERIEAFLALVITENAVQNLVAPSTIDHVWKRHVLDTTQLLKFDQTGRWIDIGTGGGFPGVVVALLRETEVLLVEPRKRRGEFLSQCVEKLGITNAKVMTARVETIEDIASVISARAVASVEKILHMAVHCANERTRWLLPRGRFGQADLVALRQNWRGVFHVEQSLTDPESSILILDGVTRR